MRSSAQSALRAVNRHFYDRFASEFDATRERPWPGWERVADRLAPGAEVTVLDAGCGNGRFGAFLAGRLTGPVRYLGFDTCAGLLHAAAARLDGLLEAPELRRLDVLEATQLDRALGNQHFDLVALFGVLHHVPGHDARRRLLRRLSRRLAPAGMMAASIWQLDRSPRFARQVVPWESYNRRRLRLGLAPLDLEALEAGDTLLSWGGSSEHPRYCHFPHDAEIESLIAAPRTPLTDRFRADGRSGRDNLYLVWRP